MGRKWTNGGKEFEANDALDGALQCLNDKLGGLADVAMRTCCLVARQLADTQAELAALKAEKGMESMGFAKVDKLRDDVVGAAIEYRTELFSNPQPTLQRARELMGNLSGALYALQEARQPRQSQADISNDRS